MSYPGQPDPGQWGPPQQGQPGGSWGGDPMQPAMPAGAGQPGYPPPQQPPGQVAVPLWIASDWSLGAQIALLGQLLLLLGAALVTVVGVLRQIAAIGLDRIDWAATSVRPLVELLGLNGAGSGEPLLLTGVLYAYLAYRVIARRHPRTLGMLVADRPRTFALGVKIGLVSAAVLLVIAILLNSFADQLVLRSPSIAMTTSIDFTALVFFTVFVGAVPAFLAVLAGAQLSLSRFLGVKPASSSMLRGGVAGSRRTLLVGGASLLALSTLGNLLDRFGATSGFGGVLGELVLTIEELVLQWLDRAILLLLGAAKFLHDGGFLWYFGATPEAWMWVSLPVLAAAFIVGGIAAAKLAGPRTQAEAMKASVLVGPMVAVVSLLVAIGWAGQAYIQDIIPIAILLPSLWGILSVGGAWLWASQQGLPSGLVVGDAAQGYPTQAPPGGVAQGPPQNTSPGTPPGASWAPPVASPPAGPAPATSPAPFPEQSAGADWGPPAGSAPAGESGVDPQAQQWGAPAGGSGVDPQAQQWGAPAGGSGVDPRTQPWVPPVSNRGPAHPPVQPPPAGPDVPAQDVDLDSLPPPSAPGNDR